jgi:hypothetical protein
MCVFVFLQPMLQQKAVCAALVQRQWLFSGLCQKL